MFRTLSSLFVLLACYGTDWITAKTHPAQNDYFELSIIHINDFHARFVQTSPTSSTCRKDREHECIGGLGRVVTATRQLLAERPNPIFLNAGDHFQGTLWYNVHKWNATAHFMNKLPHDAMTIGNHEFDDDVSGLIPFLQRVRAPVVVTNIDDSKEPKLQGYYKNSTIIVRGNRTIGVIGVIIKTTNTLSNTGKLKFLDEVETVNAEAELLKAKGVNIIIVLSHVGLDLDRIIAAKCPDVDVIVGGHSHTFLYSGKPPFLDRPEDEYPVVVKQNHTGRTVLIVQASAFTRYLGDLTVRFDKQNEVADWSGNPILLDNTIKEDPKIIEELKPWAEEVKAVGEKVVGKSRTFLNGSCRSGECNMANLITDAMVYAYEKKSESSKHWTYAAISCINAGGIRSDIPAGQITFGDLATVLPFDHTWDVLEIKGNDLETALEESVSRGRDKDSFNDAGFLQWSGIRVVFNMSMPAWSRVQSLSVSCQACKSQKYEPLHRDQWYRVVVVSYVYQGGDGLKTIARKYRNLQLGSLDVALLVEYVEHVTPVNYKLDGRIQLVD